MPRKDKGNDSVKRWAPFAFVLNHFPILPNRISGGSNGFEDYEYYLLLERAIAANPSHSRVAEARQALAVKPEVWSSWVSYATDPKVLYNERAHIADLIISLSGGGPPHPPAKEGDLNKDGRIDVMDLGILLSAWGPTDKPAVDRNQDGQVEVIDLGILLSNWGQKAGAGEIRSPDREIFF